MRIIVTGGCGFIGSNLIKRIISKTNWEILNIDSLTYASSESSLKDVKNSSKYSFLKMDIQDKKKLERSIFDFSPNYIMNLAAESHVDNSIESPENFINTNILGTYNLLRITSNFLKKQKINSKFIYHQISTDEVYGSLSSSEKPFTEQSPYMPSSPYSASKSSSDHLVHAWNKTFKLPTIITNCSNNYGPYQHKEKLIPKVIFNALNNKKIPIYGSGKNIRDWIFVEDHADALIKVARRGKAGETYNIGAHQEYSNIDLVKEICTYLDSKVPKNCSYLDQIEFVDDRPGHDFRYAIDSRKIEKNLGWKAKIELKKGIKKTVDWYIKELNNSKSLG